MKSLRQHFPKTHDRRRGFTLLELLVVMAIIAVLASLLMPVIQQARETARKTQCTNNLRQIGLAIHSFHDAKYKLPSSGRPPQASTVRAGVFIYLLPYLEQRSLWDAYDTSVTWSHASNLPVSSLRISTYECPSSPKHNDTLDHNPDGVVAGDPWDGIVAVGDYAASLGVDPALEPLAAALTPPVIVRGSIATTSSGSDSTNGMLPKNSALRLQDVTDGLSNTIAIFESGGRPFVYRRGPTQVSADLSNVRVNGGGWVRPASDILFSGSSKDGLQIPGAFVNRTNGLDIGGEDYGPTGYLSVGTEGSSQPFAFHLGGMNVLLGDGSVRFLDEEISIGVIAALVTRNQAGEEAKLSSNF
jgi:prepilin-type N-terminal cleavage/methylation domain-containing protein/prepilin-type processing-associated H-X9-DG protein